MKLKIFAVFTLLSFLIFWPVFLGKVNLNSNLMLSFYQIYGENLPYKLTGLDQLRIYFPFYKVTLEAFRNFSFPLWNPYAFSGHPHLADFQSAVFYPLNLLGIFLPQIEFWHLLRITPTILGSFFTFLYLRNLNFSGGKNLSVMASFFGALTFGFSPFILTWGEEVVQSVHSIIWLPLILWGIDKFLQLEGVKASPRLRLVEAGRFRGGFADNKKLYLALISFSWAFSLFGGYMQTSIYVFIFASAYLVFRVLEPRSNLRDLKGLNLTGVAVVLIAFVLGTGIAAVALLPSAELYFNSARSSITLKETLFNFLLPPSSVLTFFSPDFFGNPATHNFFRPGVAQYYEGILFTGVLALVFAVFALVVRQKDPFIKFVFLAFSISLLTTFDLPSAKLFLSLPLPFLSSSIPNRVLFVGAFCIAVAASYGFDEWYVKRNWKIIKVLAGFGLFYFLAGAYLLGVIIFNFPYWHLAADQNLSHSALISLRTLVVPLAIFVLCCGLIALSVFGKRRILAVFLILVSFVHIFYFSQKYFSFADRGNTYPSNPALNYLIEKQGYFRSWGVGAATLENNFASQYGLFWPGGYDSLNNRSYAEFTYAMQGNKVSDYISRADAGLGSGGNGAELLSDPERRKLLDFVSVKYVVVLKSEEENLDLNNFEKVFGFSAGGVDKLSIWENKTVLPRAFLASNYEGPPDLVGGTEETKSQKREREKERRKLIFDKLLSGYFDYRNVIVLEKPSPTSPQFGEGSAEILSYKPQEVLIKTNSGVPKLLYLSDNYYPGWKATVDGDETEILRANYTFRAVPLTPGEHMVEFYYDSVVFETGLVISFVSLGLLILFLKFNSRKLN